MRAIGSHTVAEHDGNFTVNNHAPLRRLGITRKLADELWKKLNTAKTLPNSIGAFKHDLTVLGKSTTGVP